jgi:hypothetical protein
MDGQTDKRMDGWMDGWADGRMDKVVTGDSMLKKGMYILRVRI